MGILRWSRESLAAAIDAITQILWIFHRDHLRRIVVSLLNRLIDQTADATVELIATNLATEVMTADAHGFYIPNINLRYLWQVDGYALAVIERTPHCRTVRFSRDFVQMYSTRVWRGEQSGEFYLAFPFVVYVITQNPDEGTRLYIYYRTLPWTRIDNVLLQCNLPNVYDKSGGTCLGGYVTRETELLSAAVDLTSRFELGQHNLDLTSNYQDAARCCKWLAHIDWWEVVSREDPRRIVRDYPLLHCPMNVAAHLSVLQQRAASTAEDRFRGRCNRLLPLLNMTGLVRTTDEQLKAALAVAPELPKRTRHDLSHAIERSSP